jgi:hypothetical protein
MKELPLHVIIKELANTPWSKLPEDCLRSIHTQLIPNVGVGKLRTLIIPRYVVTAISGKFSDLEVTYQFEDAGLLKPILIVDEVFLGEVNITELLSEKAMEDIACEAEALLKREALMEYTGRN